MVSHTSLLDYTHLHDVCQRLVMRSLVYYMFVTSQQISWCTTIRIAKLITNQHYLCYLIKYESSRLHTFAWCVLMIGHASLVYYMFVTSQQTSWCTPIRIAKFITNQHNLRPILSWTQDLSKQTMWTWHMCIFMYSCT